MAGASTSGAPGTRQPANNMAKLISARGQTAPFDIMETMDNLMPQLVDGGFLEKLTTEEIALYFFLVLVSGPEGTSYWGYKSISKLLKIPDDDIIHATAGLVKKGLIAFRYPTFQILSLPSTEAQHGGRP